MAKGFKHGTSGAPLNFKVVGNPKPAAPMENTIWINTNAINRYYFSPTQPDNMDTHDVWIVTGSSGPAAFNALRKNGIILCPILAKQQVDGSLANVEAQIYKDGKWTDWKFFIFESGLFGTEYRASTDGTDLYCAGYGAGIADIQYGELVFGDNTAGNSCGGFIFENVDLTDYSTLKITRSKQTHFYGSELTGEGVFAVFINDNKVYWDVNRNIAQPETLNIDVSSYGNGCKIVLVAYNSGYVGNQLIAYVSAIIPE